MAQVIETTITPFQRMLACRRVTNFPGDTVDEAAKKAFEGGLCGIRQFKKAVTEGLIVPRHRRYGRIRTGYRTLTPAEREAREIQLNGGRIIKKKHDLRAADCRKLARQNERVSKKERLQARTPLQDLIQVPEPVLTQKDQRRKPVPWYPATDPLPMY
jgi:hypothetical protein